MEGSLPNYHSSQTEQYSFNEELMALSKSNSVDDWRARFERLLHQKGFFLYLFSLGKSTGNEDMFSHIETTFPQGWLDYYRENDYREVDPIVKHSKCCYLPLFWSEKAAMSHGRSRDFWRSRELYGLEKGVSLPLRYQCKAGYLSVAHEECTLETCSDESRWRIGELFFILPFALEGLVNCRRPSQSYSLSPREMECLQWGSVGKTSWEISIILRCSERTVNFHFTNAIGKLGVNNRSQAIAVALAHGLINV